ncbi:hypothetical protein V8E36_008182 [Tilletia maclaganii]
MVRAHATQCRRPSDSRGSFTEPHLHSIKAGAAWAALEYSRYLAMHNARNPEQTRVKVVPIEENARDALCRLQCLCIAANTDLWTLNDIATGLAKRKRPTDTVPTPHWPLRSLTRQTVSLSWRALYLLPLVILHSPVILITMYLQATRASHEEESMGSAKTLVAWVLTAFLYLGLGLLISAPFLLTPPGWIVAALIIFAINQALRMTMLSGYERLKRWTGFVRLFAASVGAPLEGFALSESSPSVRLAVEKVSVGPPVQDTINKALARKGERRGLASWRRPFRARYMAVLLRTRAEARQALQLLFDALEDRAHGGDGNGTATTVSPSSSSSDHNASSSSLDPDLLAANRGQPDDVAGTVTEVISGKLFRTGGLAGQLDALEHLRYHGGRLRLEYGQKFAAQWS